MIDISVCIVNYQAKDYLRDCLHSLYEHTASTFEVILVDNGSTDGSLEMLKDEFPDVQTTENPDNLGFTRPMNQALEQGRGRYLLQLNPDTIILPAALDRLVAFLESHPEIGICGPKVLNSDGSLQKQCRRGEPTPWAVISYFTRLNRLFPDSKLFGGYLLNYMDEDETHPVAGVSGSCMLIRRAVIDQIGYLDERFFAYQEDADYCFRTREAGWEIYYMPEAQIIHYGGQGGSRVQPFRSIYAWHHSYYLYYRKNLAKDYFFLLNWAYYFIMLVKLALALLLNLFRKDETPQRR
jgi:GT2 family glycosyltransferase